MGFIINKDGDIQAGVIEFDLPEEAIRRAQMFGDTRIDGMAREVLAEIGIEVEEIEVITVNSNRTVTLKSGWARPSRR